MKSMKGLKEFLLESAGTALANRTPDRFERGELYAKTPDANIKRYRIKLCDEIANDVKRMCAGTTNRWLFHFIAPSSLNGRSTGTGINVGLNHFGWFIEKFLQDNGIEDGLGDDKITKAHLNRFKHILGLNNGNMDWDVFYTNLQKSKYYKQLDCPNLKIKPGQDGEIGIHFESFEDENGVGVDKNILKNQVVQVLDAISDFVHNVVRDAMGFH